MAGGYRRALIVAAEVGSPGLDWSQPESAAIIGDGAAAVVVESMEPDIPPPLSPPCILATAFQTWSEGVEFTTIRGGGSARPARLFTPAQEKHYLFQMDGPAVFRLASRHLPGFVRAYLEDHGWTWQDFALVIPHQGSPASVALLRRRLGIPTDRLFCYAAEYGNTIAASIPMGLSRPRRRARGVRRLGPPPRHFCWLFHGGSCPAAVIRTRTPADWGIQAGGPGWGIPREGNTPISSDWAENRIPKRGWIA